MILPEILHTLADRLAATVTSKNVYSDPVTVGDRTVIPIAKVRLGLGAGIGGRKASDASQGGGGGGIVSYPVGALEITEAGTRYISFNEWPKLEVAFLAGLAAGAALMWSASRNRSAR